MTRKQRRMTMIGSIGAVLTVVAGLLFYAFSNQITYFQTPADIAENLVEPGQRIRLGGLVAMESVERSDGELVRFAVEDAVHTVKVVYRGILPDLFREGQGVVTEGVMQADGTFKADSVLAKHDENYMPREVADALKEQGHWQGGQE